MQNMVQKKQLANFEKKIKKGKSSEEKAFVTKMNLTGVYLWNVNRTLPSKRGILTTAATSGKRINFYATGKEDNDKIDLKQWGLGTITRHTQQGIDASAELPSDFEDEFIRSAQSLTNDDEE